MCEADEGSHTLGSDRHCDYKHKGEALSTKSNWENGKYLFSLWRLSTWVLYVLYNSACSQSSYSKHCRVSKETFTPSPWTFCQLCYLYSSKQNIYENWLRKSHFPNNLSTTSSSHSEKLIRKLQVLLAGKTKPRLNFHMRTQSSSLIEIMEKGQCLWCIQTKGNNRLFVSAFQNAYDHYKNDSY